MPNHQDFFTIHKMVTYSKYSILVPWLNLSFSARIDVCKRRRAGFTYETLAPRMRCKRCDARFSLIYIQVLPEGNHTFRPAERTLDKACHCSKTLSIIFCLESHMVGHSVLSECSGRLCSCLFASFRAIISFQL